MPLFRRQLVPKKKRVFLTTLDVCCRKSSGHQAVKFGRNNYLYWDYNLTKYHSVRGGRVVTCVDLTWNDPVGKNKDSWSIKQGKSGERSVTLV
jgi:hypothetical protein